MKIRQFNWAIIVAVFIVLSYTVVNIVNAENDGYKLFWDGKRVGNEPTCSLEEAVINLQWNTKQYPDKDVKGYFNGVRIQASGTGYELYFDGKRVGNEPTCSLEEAVKNLQWNTKQYPDKKVTGFYNGKKM